MGMAAQHGVTVPDALQTDQEWLSGSYSIEFSASESETDETAGQAGSSKPWIQQLALVQKVTEVPTTSSQVGEAGVGINKQIDNL